MRNYPHVKESKHTFFTEHCKTVHQMLRMLDKLRRGCGMIPGLKWEKEVIQIDSQLRSAYVTLKRGAGRK